jgi:hypothetical protein
MVWNFKDYKNNKNKFTIEFLIIQVYYEELTYTSIEESKKTEIADLVSV